jgi:hypothetical protein
MKECFVIRTLCMFQSVNTTKPCVVETPKNWKLSDKSKKEVKVA